VHGNLCGPVMSSTPGGNKFFFLLIEDLSRIMWDSLMSSKDQAMASFVLFKSRAKAKFVRKIGTFCTDHGGEFTTRAFIDHCMELGIQRHFTAPYTLEQNGVVERHNETIMGMARSILKVMAMPGWFWGEAVATAVYLLNRSPT
jgi:transposase InsO family protein